MKVSVSFLSDKYNPKDIIKTANLSSCDYLHVDVMDGKFVENKTFSYGEIKKLVFSSTKKLDVHLMVNNPIKYIEDYALLNTEYLTFHYESVKNVSEVIEKIKNYGLKVGISIKPNTNISEIIPFLNEVNLVLIMSVEPGKSGQNFKESVLYKIEALNKVRKEQKINFLISVDGGINETNIDKLKEIGADMVVSASYLHEGNMEEKIKLLKN